MQESASIVVGLGELLWDCFGETRRPGGAPANVAFHAGQLGAQGIICSRVGQDALGDELVAFLQSHGLGVDYVQRDADFPTSQVTVHGEQVEGPSYTIHENVAWDRLAFTPALAELMCRAAAVCFGTLVQRTATSRETVNACLDQAENALIIYDVNLRPPFVEKAWIEASLHRANVVKLNHDEERVLNELLALGATDTDSFAAAIRARYGCEVICITRGGEGCYLSDAGGRAETRGLQVAVADTVGAGDAFTAALTCGLLAEWPLPKVARFANEVGALVASRPGAMPALAAEFSALRDRLGSGTS